MLNTKFWCKKVNENGQVLDDNLGLVIGDQKTTIVTQEANGKVNQQEIELFIVVFPTIEDSPIEFLTQEQIRFTELFDEVEYFSEDDDVEDTEDTELDLEGAAIDDGSRLEV